MPLDNSSSNNNKINKNIISLKVNSDESMKIDDEIDMSVNADLATNPEYLKALRTIMDLGYLSKDEMRLWLWLFTAGGTIVNYQRQIARELRMTRSSLSKAIKRLTQYGLVRRKDLYVQELPGLPAKIIYIRLILDVDGTIQYAQELLQDFHQHVTDYASKLDSFKRRHLDAYDQRFDTDSKHDILKVAMENPVLNKEVSDWYIFNHRDSEMSSEEAAKKAWEVMGNLIAIDDDMNEEKYGSDIASQNNQFPKLPYEVYEALVRVSRRDSLRFKLDECCAKYMEQYKASGYYEETRGIKFGVKTGTVDFESAPLYVNPL